MLSAAGFFDRVAALQREGRPFAVATVVARRAPVSAHLGDRAIILADGRMDGFVGGACTREIVRTQALEAIRTRSARLVSIRPDARESSTDTDRVVVPMTCASEGAVDVYVEPIVQARSVVVAGATPVAEAVARLARAMRYTVIRVVDPAERQDVEAVAEAIGTRVATLDDLPGILREALADEGECVAVVASQGHYDEPALEAILTAGVTYAGLVASRKRGDEIRAWLRENGTPNLERLRSPAGLDLGGRSPEDVAISILAEIVQGGASGGAVAAAVAHVEKPRDPKTSAPQDPKPPGPQAPQTSTAIDPVCHMAVTITGAAHVAEVEGITYYFCCPGCRARFTRDPQRYLAVS